MKPLSGEEVAQRVSRLAFGNRLVSNMYRGLVAEVIVASALEDATEWKHCSEDWSGWDFEHTNGCRLEVKQSAYIQSWKRERVSACKFGIAASKGYWRGDVYTSDTRRKAAIYVFAHHWVKERQVVDHRDPKQWLFYIVPASFLPDGQESMALSVIKTLAEPRDYSQLSGEIGHQNAIWQAGSLTLV